MSTNSERRTLVERYSVLTKEVGENGKKATNYSIHCKLCNTNYKGQLSTAINHLIQGNVGKVRTKKCRNYSDADGTLIADLKAHVTSSTDLSSTGSMPIIGVKRSAPASEADIASIQFLYSSFY